jgi:hypothetical protein
LISFTCTPSMQSSSDGFNSYWIWVSDSNLIALCTKHLTMACDGMKAITEG